MDNGLTGVSDCRALARSATRRPRTGDPNMAFVGKVIPAATGEHTHAAAVLQFEIRIGSNW